METDKQKPSIGFYPKLALGLLFLSLNITSVLYFAEFRSPANFPGGLIYTVAKGTGLNNLAANLYSQNIIRSPFWFKTFSVVLGGTKGLVAGDYVLDNDENAFSLARRLTSGDYQLQQIKITLPEGLNVYEMAKLISAKFAKITEQNFIDKAKNLEGYLFPDTYIFQTNTGVYTVIEAMQANFQKKISLVTELIKASKKSQSDIIKMASILEEEARTMETRQIVAGILWKRLALGMPLQVDSSFKYINGKTTATLSLADLKIDSPYNSYVYKGLPPTPICNPGLDAIKAALTPASTNYLYFLTDKDGNMHYARTYEEHLANKLKYLP